MAFRKTYVINDHRVNTHGFVVDNDGLDITVALQNCPAFYDHVYLDVPIGHWENIRKEGEKTLAELVIDGKSEVEKEMIRKIENGDVKGASLGADPIEWGYADINGEMVKCLKKSELFEISITPLPSNAASLALKHKGVAVRLSGLATDIIPLVEEQFKTDMKTIAVKLGLNENASESEVLDAIGGLQRENAHNKTFATTVLDNAKEGLTEEQSGIMVTLSKTDVAQALAYANGIKLSNAATNPAPGLNKDVKLSDLFQKGTASSANPDMKDSFDYLSKYNKVELARIRAEEPEKYAQLTADYAKGVRSK